MSGLSAAFLSAAYPLLGALVVVGALMPVVAAVIAAAVTGVVGERGGDDDRADARYFAVVGASALPLVWCVSAAMHQLEGGRSVVACLLDDAEAARCFEPGALAALLGVGVVAAWWRIARRGPRVAAGESAAARREADRITKVVAATPMLSALRGRIHVSDGTELAVCTHGMWRPRVAVSVAWAEQVGDDVLVAALAHELQHVRARDPLRYGVLQLALAVNPVGRRWLAAHATRWVAAREVHCDRGAVLEGAEPLALAEAIVRAARPSLQRVVPAVSTVAVAPLGGTDGAGGASDTSAISRRVRLLVGFSERAPSACGCARRAAWPWAVVGLIAAMVMPHHTGTQALDALHIGAEHAVHWLWHLW